MSFFFFWTGVLKYSGRQKFPKHARRAITHCTRERQAPRQKWLATPPQKKTGSLAFIETLFFIYCFLFFSAVNLYTLYRCKFALKAWVVSCHEREEIQQPSTECQRSRRSLNMADQPSDTGQSMMGVADTHSLGETIPPFWFFFFFCLQVSGGGIVVLESVLETRGNPLKMLRCWHG